MNTALVLRETEKALQIKFGCCIYESIISVKTWIPKSQIEIFDRDHDKITFMPKNDWIIDAKVRDYIKFLKSANCSLSSDLQLYLSNINCEKVDFVYA